MALPSSGSIGLGQVNVELGFGSTTSQSLDAASVRSLAGRPTSGSVISMSDLLGKSACPPAGQAVGGQYCGSGANQYTLYQNRTDGTCGTYAEVVATNSAACGYVAYPAAGTPSGSPYCSGYTKYQNYHNGSGGTYATALENNSTFCGFDGTPPTVSISFSANNLTSGQTSQLTFSFSEAVQGDFAPSQSGGGISSFRQGSGSYYYQTFIPPDQVNGSTTFSLPPGSFRDTFGNYNSSGGSATIYYNTVTAQPFYVESGDMLSEGEPTGTQFTDSRFIDVFPYGGVPPYTYQWSVVTANGATTAGSLTASSLNVRHVITKFGYTGISVFNCVVTDSIGQTYSVNVDAEWRWDDVPI